MNCLECEKGLSQIEGKREKQFCNSTCRSNYWQKSKRRIANNNKPENKKRILKKRNTVSDHSEHDISQPIPENSQYFTSEVNNSLILAEIEKVKNAKIPDGMSKKVWEFDQNKKLKMLNLQLK